MSTSLNLGQIAAIHISTTAPSNTKMLWYDDNIGIKIVKYYDIGTTTWKAFDGIGVFLPLTGGTVTGFVTLHANPTANLHAATKQYVDTAVSGAAGTLAAVLSGGNTTGANDIEVSATQVIKYSNGFGGSLTAATTTGAAKTWTLPDATGTLLLGSGTTNRVATWNSGALTSGVLQDDGTTVGIGALSGSIAFNITSTLGLGIRIITSDTSGGTSIFGLSNGVNASGDNIGALFTGSDSLAGNIGIQATGDASGNASPATAQGGIFVGTGGVDVVVGAEGMFSSIGTESVGLIGRNNIAAFSGSNLIAGLYGGLDENGLYALGTDNLTVHSSVVGHYKGTATVSSAKYTAYFKNEVTNAAAANYGAYLEASGGLTNYALITGGGLVGLGVAIPTKQLEVSSGTGVITYDTTGVTTTYDYDTLLTDTNVAFSTSIARGYSYSVNGTIVESILATGGLAVGVHTSNDSHLHVKFSGALADMDGGIRSTMSNATPYVYALPVFADSLVLENESAIASNTNAIVFRGKDTGGTTRDSAYISSRYHTRGPSNLSSDLMFGVSTESDLLEAMRIHSTTNVSIGSETENGKFFVLLNSGTVDGATIRQDNEGTTTKARLAVEHKDATTVYTTIELLASGTGSVSGGGYVGDDKYFEKAGHLATGDDHGHLNIFARTNGAAPTHEIRMFTGGDEWVEANLRMTLTGAGKFGFNLAKAGYTGSLVDEPIGNFHVGTGAMFEADGSTAPGHFIIKNDSVDSTDYGGLVLTGDAGFGEAKVGYNGFKFTTTNTDTSGGTADDKMKIGLVAATATQTWIYEMMAFSSGYVTIGSHDTGNEALTVMGVTSLQEQGTSPSNTTGFGKIYSKTDNNLYYLDGVGAEFQLNVSSSSTNVWVPTQQSTSDYTAADKDYVLIRAATHILTLPPAVAGARVGAKSIIAVTDVVVKTEASSGSQIDGVTRDVTGLAIAAQWNGYVFVSDGTDWFIESSI